VTNDFAQPHDWSMPTGTTHDRGKTPANHKETQEKIAQDRTTLRTRALDFSVFLSSQSAIYIRNIPPGWAGGLSNKPSQKTRGS
jgi:hypothetical protein